MARQQPSESPRNRHDGSDTGKGADDDQHEARDRPDHCGEPRRGRIEASHPQDGPNEEGAARQYTLVGRPPRFRIGGSPPLCTSDHEERPEHQARHQRAEGDQRPETAAILGRTDGGCG